MFGTLMLAVCCSPVVNADSTPLTYDRISLSVSEQDAVDNDVLVAVMFAQSEGSDAAALAGEVNGRIARAVEQAKGFDAIKLQTLDYQTDPVYRNNRVDGWRVSQALRLESRDADALSRLVGTLQNELAIRSIGYEVSPQKRGAAEEALINRAIQRFNARARQITEAFGRKDYRIVDVRVDSGGFFPSPQFRAAPLMALEAAAPPPTLEAGTQDVMVEVSGTIELH